VSLLVPDASAALRMGQTEAWVVDDDGMLEHPWVECRTENARAHGSIEHITAG